MKGPFFFQLICFLLIYLIKFHDFIFSEDYAFAQRKQQQTREFFAAAKAFLAEREVYIISLFYCSFVYAPM
jgi:hypothetical protein